MSLSVDKALRQAQSHLKAGELAEAEELYKQVLSKFPKNKKAIQGYQKLKAGITSKGSLNSEPPAEKIQELINLYNQGQFEIVLTITKPLIELFPKAFVLLNLEGSAYAALKKYSFATERFKKALKLNPNYADGHSNLGICFKQMGYLDKAIESFESALNLKPKHADALLNMGSALKDRGDHGAAIECYQRAVEIKPNFPEAYNNIGNSFKSKGNWEEAIINYKKAIAINPHYADAYINMSSALNEKGELIDSIKILEKALEIRPNHAEGLSLRLHISAMMCDWRKVENTKDKFRSQSNVENFVFYGLLGLEDEPLKDFQRTTEYVSKKYIVKSLQNSNTKISKNRRIKIGYFSSFFRQHPVSILATRTIELHDKNNFETFAFSYGKDIDDKYNSRLKNSFDHFWDVSNLSDEAIATFANNKNIDIAVELNGFMEDERVGILTHRPAPIQINYLAYPGTMGADFIDYIIADERIIPEHQTKNYSENIIYLPDCYMPQDNTRTISNKGFSRKDFGLPQNGFVFCCFNNSFKITPKEFDIWMRLLDNVEDSVLWLLKSNKWCEDNLKTEATKRGIESKRLVFADRLPLDEHLARHQLADLFLDTFNFNAHTTASDALWAGLPVVTKLGKGFCARVAGSLLNSLELNELVTSSEEEYENLALTLAKNKLKLTNIRIKLAEKRLTAPLFDSETYTRNLEKAYSHAYERHIDGLAPEGFKV